MHALHIARRLSVYRALYRLNHSFANILTQFGELQELKILKPDAARRYRSLAQELQAEINRGLAAIIETAESRNQSRFVNARKAWEVRGDPAKPRKAGAPARKNKPRVG